MMPPRHIFNFLHIYSSILSMHVIKLKLSIDISFCVAIYIAAFDGFALVVVLFTLTDSYYDFYMSAASE